MLSKNKITVLFILLSAVIFLVPQFVGAQDVYGVNDFVNVNLGTRDLRETLANIVNIVLGFLGILVTLLLLYGGFVWMTSQGDERRIETAKKIIINAVIGLVIVLASYAIARFVLFGFSGSGGIFGGNSNQGGSGYTGGTGLGAGVLESHYPARNASDIPRNTNIYVTFREPINTGFVNTSGCSSGIGSCVDDNYIQLRVNGVLVNGDDIAVSVSPDNKVFGFDPFGAGPAVLDTGTAVVRLDGLTTGNGQPAFSLGFYDWQFTIGEVTDTTAPRVTSVSPDAGDTVPRNSAVQINFSEAINPLFAAGIVPPFSNISVAAGSPLNGEYRVTNQYRTVEFVADSMCGQNSCGMDVYCLPGPAAIAATVTDNVVDMSGNRLDGDSDGAAGGSYNWSFNTDDNIDLTAPQISDMSAGTGDTFSLTEPIRVTFDKPLLSSSVNSGNVNIYQSLLGDTNYWLSLQNGNTININHDRFESSTIYTPVLKGGIMDLQQNCWYPCACDDPSGASCECNQDTSAQCAAGTYCVSIDTTGGTGGGLGGGSTPGGSCTDSDGDGYFAEGGACGTADLADNDKFLFPSAPEWCDGKDNDGDGTIDPAGVCGAKDCYAGVCKMLLTWAGLNAGHTPVLNQYDLILTNGQNATRGNLTTAMMIIHRSIVEAGSWASPFYGWATISANTSWFMKDALGNNTSSRTFTNLWLMDMSQQGYRDFMANQAGDVNTTYTGLEGYFYDNYVDLARHHGYVSDTSGLGNYPGLDIRPYYGSDSAWDSYMQDVAYRMKRSMGNKLIFGNNHGLYYNDYFDGYMAENWIHNQNANGWPNGWYPVASWQADMQVAMSAANRNKLVMLQCNNQTNNPAVLNFCFASYLLAKQPNVKTYFSYGWGSGTTVNYYPILDVDLGSPLGAYSEVSPGSYLYRRNFERGMVLVRPTDPAQSNPDVYTYNLGGSYTDAINGGTVTQVAMGDHSAAILLN